MKTPLVTTKWLHEHLEDPDVRTIEVSLKNDDTAYRQGHIPGAAWWYWKAYCWDPTDREFITPEQMAAHLGAAGISPDSTLVLYGDPVQFGCYAFWTLTMAGHRDIRLLDGARTKWQNEGRPMSTDIPTFEPVPYVASQGETSMRVGRDNVRASLDDPERLLLDLRSPEEYSGERVKAYGNFDHGAERGGRIPGAKHLYFRRLLNDDDTFKTAEELRAAFSSVGVKPDRNQKIVCYCRLSHRASLAWFALSHVLGYENVKIYDGSWTEWGSIVGFPVEK